MTSNYHTPHAFGAPDTAAELNGPLATLDAAITALVANGTFNSFNAKTGFNAVGDGVADDTTALQSMFDAAMNAGGGVCYIPTGTYKVSAMLNMPYPVRIIGDGRQLTHINYTGSTGTVFRFKNYATADQRLWCEMGLFSVHNTGGATNCVVFDVKGLTNGYIHDIYFDNFTGASSILILVDASYGGAIGAWWNQIERIRTNFCGTGIKFTGVVSAGQANENTVRDCTIVGHSVAGVHIEVGDNVTVENNDLTSAQGGIGIIAQHRHAVMRKNRFESCDTGIYIKAGTGSLTGNVVTDCMFVGNAGGTNTTNYGIRVDSAAIHTKLERNHFTGNYIIKRIKDDTTGADSTDFDRCVPIMFAVQNMAASQISTAIIPVGADSGNQRVLLGRGYSVRGITVRMNGTPSAGTLSFHATIGGTDTTLAAVWSSGGTAQAFQGRGIDEDATGGSGLGLSYTTNGAFTPTTIDATIIVWVEWLDDVA